MTHANSVKIKTWLLSFWFSENTGGIKCFSNEFSSSRYITLWLIPVCNPVTIDDTNTNPSRIGADICSYSGYPTNNPYEYFWFLSILSPFHPDPANLILTVPLQ